MMAGKKEQMLAFRVKIAGEKLSALQEILSLTKAQHKFIEDELIDSLLDNIGQRQKLIDYIDELDIKDMEFRRGGAEISQSDKSEESIRIFGFREKMKELYEAIAKQDESNKAAAETRLEGYRQEIYKTNVNKKSVETYNKAYTQSDGIYFDKKK